MIAETHRLLREIMELPIETRAALASSLLESLDDQIDENVEKEWAEEISKRINEIDQGLVKPILWDEARQRISNL